MDRSHKTQETARCIRRELLAVADKTKVSGHSLFFKTGKGQYAEGDKFIGVTVPKQRVVAKKYATLSLEEIAKLLDSNIHEERLTALIILVEQFKKGDESVQKKIYHFYLAHIGRVNNWDLVDQSAGNIVGEYLVKKDRKILYRLAHSKNIWERRIAIIATLAFIKREDFDETLAIAQILLSDQHDLIHKAVGWMLREVGKRDVATLERFLVKHVHDMPRTSLRYAIERFPKEERKKYLSL